MTDKVTTSLRRRSWWAVAAICALAATIASAAALAATPGKRATVLSDRQAVTHGGITCTAYGAASAASANLVCVKNTLKGYGVIVSSKSIIVAKIAKGKLTVIFQHANR